MIAIVAAVTMAIVSAAAGGQRPGHRATGAMVWQAGLSARLAGYSYLGDPPVLPWPLRVCQAAVLVRCRAEARVGEETISRRDADELAACYAADAAGLFGYACVLARGDRALAEDLVQAAFEAAAHAWGILRCLADEPRRGWLRATVANIAVSGFRREAAWRKRLPRIEARYRKEQGETEDLALSSIVLERCWQIIKDMPERQHAAAVLRWQQGMKQAEIAATLGMAEKTVSVHLHRARRQLIAQLGRDCPFAGDDGEGGAS